MGHRRHGESFGKWLSKGLVRGVLGLALAALATYLIYRVVLSAFTTNLVGQ